MLKMEETKEEIMRANAAETHGTGNKEEIMHANVNETHGTGNKAEVVVVRSEEEETPESNEMHDNTLVAEENTENKLMTTRYVDRLAKDVS